MNNLSNQEMACFKAALALVVVKNRLKQQRQQQGKKRSEDDDDHAQSSKKSRTTIFPWSSSTTQSNSLPAAGSQKEHLQTMMDTAIGRAMRLVTANDNNDKASWSTLNALTAHLAQQLTFSLSTPNQWVAGWIRDNLRMETTTTDHVKAAYLVWHGILLGDNSNIKKKKQIIAPPSCRRLFLEVYCSILQQKGIIPSSTDDPTKKAAATTTVAAAKSPPKATKKSQKAVVSPKTPTITNVKKKNRKSALISAGQTKKKAKKSTTFAIELPSKTAAAPTSRGNIPRSKAWQRLFSATYRNRKKNRGIDSSKPQALLDTWVVHGLQVMQKVASLDNNKQGGNALEQLPPTAFLPPSDDLMHWYAEAADQRLEHPASALDPGAKLMTMVVLYRAQAGIPPPVVVLPRTNKTTARTKLANKLID